MVATSLCLVRHAESVWNADGRWQGHGDPPLSKRGREQADALARALAGETLDAIFSSDLQRARETAAALAGATGLEVRFDPAWRELDIGRWTGLVREEIARADGETLARFEAEEPDARPDGGETRRELRVRVRAAATSLAEAWPGARLAVVTHLGVIRALTGGKALPNAGHVWVTWPRDAPAAELPA